MASRRVTAARRQALLDGIRDEIRRGDLRPGDRLPPLRDLAERHQLARRTVAEELRLLVGEGVLRVIPSVGFLVEQPVGGVDDIYLVLTPAEGRSNWNWQGRSAAAAIEGFEREVTSYGARSLVLPENIAVAELASGELSAPAGIFAMFAGSSITDRRWDELEVNWVGYGDSSRLPRADLVDLDNLDGGRKAAQQLIRRGHRRIAYLGLHGAAVVEGADWSRQREQGCRDAVDNSGDGEFIAFHPAPDAHPPRGDRSLADARLISVSRAACAHRASYTAVVAADDQVLIAFTEALRESQVDPDEWPAMVGFEGLAGASDHVVSSVRPRWHELGAAAAELLWQRRMGRLSGPPERRVVSMDVIARVQRIAVSHP